MTTISRRELIKGLAAAAMIPLLNGRDEDTAAAPALRPSTLVPEKISERFTSLPFADQQLGGLLAERMKINVDKRLLQVDEKTFLAGFLGRDSEGDTGGAWLGEHIGKFLEAACHSLRYQDNADLRRLTERMARTLISTQGEDGYLGTYPRDKRWTSWDPWVHKYNLVGLLAYHELTGESGALIACRRIGDLLDRTFGEKPGQLDLVHVGEHRGMASTSVLEPMCRLYRHTAEPRFLEFCHYIVRSYNHPGGPRIVQSLLEVDDVERTANAKAYEMLSNFNGLIDFYRLTGDEKILTAVLRAWGDIVTNQLYCTGTMSAGEDFLPDRRFLSLQSSFVGETCVNVTWLQLNWRLLRLTGEACYGEEIERTVYNHLLGCQDVRTGNISYYTALVGPKRFRDEVLCCVSSAPRAFALLPQLAWGVEQNALAIHLYTAGQARCVIGGVPVLVIVETLFPTEGEVMLTLRPERPVHFAVRLRVPAWTTRFEVRTGAKTLRGEGGRMLDVAETWQNGTELKISMDLPVSLVAGGTAYPDYVAVRRGPQVLALEKGLNPGAPYLHRVALTGSAVMPTLAPVAPGDWPGHQVYEMPAAVGVPETATDLRSVQKSVRLVPFADAVDCRVWLSRADRFRRDIPAVSAFAFAGSSEQKFVPDGEFLTDENPRTWCTADPRNPRPSRYFGRPMGQKGGGVSFITVLDAPQAITRVVFCHGPLSDAGGWFDTSKGKPVILIARQAKQSQDGFKPDPDDWEKVAVVTNYPTTSATIPPALEEGHRFEIVLPHPVTVYAIQLAGNTGGGYVTCAELGAYSVKG